ncbi:hypothetical protein CY652_10530 [Burkholderia sp. WAC0059]|nr:hypothetical protein CY652_10530 [Burkholderia sp. WAC0059]
MLRAVTGAASIAALLALSGCYYYPPYYPAYPAGVPTAATGQYAAAPATAGSGTSAATAPMPAVPGGPSPDDGQYPGSIYTAPPIAPAYYPAYPAYYPAYPAYYPYGYGGYYGWGGPAISLGFGGYWGERGWGGGRWGGGRWGGGGWRR